LDPSDVDDLLRRAEHNQVSGRTMSFNEMKVLGNAIAVQKGHIEPHQQLSGPIMAQLKKDVQERGFVVSRVGLSTSLARTESCTVEHISPFFNSLAALRKEHPEIWTEPGRLGFFDEKVKLRC
jgi:hypothetical protein